MQLGPGRANYIPGWVNVDANLVTAKLDVWADIGNKLPFRDNTVDVFYSHHVIEHLPETRLLDHFRDMYRCLKPGGVIRVGGPNADSAIRKLQEGDSPWFGDFPDKRESIGGRFSNFILCRGEHLSILTASFLTEVATAAGFAEIRFCKPIKETNFPQWINEAVLSKEWESCEDCPHTILLEARKPALNR